MIWQVAIVTRLFLFISGRVNSSAIPTEVAYTLSNLIVLVNDQIIRSGTTTGAPEDRVRLLLTTLEYCEVIFEISAQRLWGMFAGMSENFWNETG